MLSLDLVVVDGVRFSAARCLRNPPAVRVRSAAYAASPFDVGSDHRQRRLRAVPACASDADARHGAGAASRCAVPAAWLLNAVSMEEGSPTASLFAVLKMFPAT
jgi:hypothetical protein